MVRAGSVDCSANELSSVLIGTSTTTTAYVMHWTRLVFGGVAQPPPRIHREFRENSGDTILITAHVRQRGKFWLTRRHEDVASARREFHPFYIRRKLRRSRIDGAKHDGIPASSCLGGEFRGHWKSGDKIQLPTYPGYPSETAI